MNPKPFWIQREFWVFLPVYFFVSFIELSLKLQAATDTWFKWAVLERNHQLLWHFQYYNNEQSRLLQFVIPQAILKVTHISTPHAYMAQRFVFIFLALTCFHWYLRKWFSAEGSFAGVAILAAMMPLSFSDDLQESAPLLMLLFVLGLWAIREKKTLLFELVLLVGSVTNETMLILPSVYFFYRFRPVPIKQIDFAYVKEFFRCIRDTILVALPPFIIVGVIRYITRDRPHLGGDVLVWNQNWSKLWDALTHTNIFNLYRAHFLFFILLFSVFWLYAILGYRKSGLFLQRAFWMVPLFLLAHFVTAKIDESRQMVPLGFILIPMGLSFMFSKELDKPAAGVDSFNPEDQPGEPAEAKPIRRSTAAPAEG